MKSPLVLGWTRVESGLTFLPIANVAWTRPVKLWIFTVAWQWMVTRLGSHDPVVEGFGFRKGDAKRQAVAWARSLHKP